MPLLEPYLPASDVNSDNLVYYLDEDLRFVWANKAFDRFALQNDTENLAHLLHGKAVTDMMTGIQRARWMAIYRDIAAGRISTHREHFACPSPQIRRRFTYEIERRDIGGAAYLRHETHLNCERPGGKDDPAPLREQDGLAGRVRFHAMSRSPDEASGDAFTVRGMADGRVAILIADAMGSGDSAAPAAMRLLEVLEELPLESPVQTVRDANRAYLARLEGTPGFTPFVTGILMVVDPTAMTLQATCFGHQGVIITPAGLMEAPTGLPIGIQEDEENWPVTTFFLRHTGRRLLAFTDGITEQFDPSGAMYGEHRLTREFQGTMDQPLRTSLEAIFTSLDQWRGDAIIKDDQTLLAFEVIP